MQNYKLVGNQAEKPVIMGEFGASRPNYALVADAAAALKAWQIGGCAYHMKGWLLWTWDTDPRRPSLDVGILAQARAGNSLGRAVYMEKRPS
jgi:hypothetical protein